MQLKDVKIGKRYKVIGGAQHGAWFDWSVGRIGKVINVKGKVVYMTFENGDTDYGEADGLQPISPTCFEELREGDVVLNREGEERTVLFGNGSVIIYEYPSGNIAIFSKTIFEKNGFTIMAYEKSEEVTELSMNDVAKLAGVPVSKLKIKKD